MRAIIRPQLLTLLALLSLGLPSPGQAESGATSAFKEEVAGIAKASRVKIAFHESEAFVFGMAVPAAKAKPIMKAANDAWKVWSEISGMKDPKEIFGRKKCLFLVTNNIGQYRRVIKWFDSKHTTYGGFAEFASKTNYWPQPYPRVTIFMHAKPLSYKGLRNAAAHMVGHMLMHRYAYHNRPIPPWLEEGFGAYLEARVMKSTNCYCFTGGYGDKAAGLDKISELKWTKWKEAVVKLAKKGRDKPLRSLLPIRLSNLSHSEVGKAWSVIDWMIKKDPKKFLLFLRKMKGAWPSEYSPEWSDAKFKAQERGLQDSFGISIDELDNTWRKWAKSSMKKM